MEVLSPRALNRALLARQWLLDRVDVTPVEAVEHLVGLQAQATPPPYYGLWSRLAPFDADALGRLLTERALVRMTLMRGTVHLVTPRDAAFLRPLIQPMIERQHRGQFGRRMGETTPEQVAATARELLRDEPRTAREVARALGGDEQALANAVRTYAPVLQVPPRGILGQGGQARFAFFEDWTGLALEEAPSLERLVERYLRAFGPATVMDAQKWSGLTKLKPVFERMDLLRFDGGYFDVAGAPHPDPETPAPVRLLGEYDNVLLGHADRSRIVPPGFPWEEMLSYGRYVNNLLVDGMLRATWWLERDGTLAIRPFGVIPYDEVEAEARAMSAFAGSGDVRFEPALPSSA